MKFLNLIWSFLKRWAGVETPSPPSPPVSPPISPPPPSPPPVEPLPEGLELLLKLHNDERLKRGLPGLQSHPILSRAAQKHTEWMARENRLSHRGQGGSQPWDRVSEEGYQYSSVGENIAYGYTSPESVFRGWMNSKGHKANILARGYSQIGFGYVRGVRPFWTVVFARPGSGQLQNLDGESDVSVPNNSTPPPITNPLEKEL